MAPILELLDVSTSRTPTETLAARYGAPSRGRRRGLLAGVAVLAVAFLGWLTWAVLGQSAPAAASGELVFDIESDSQVSASFTVDLRDDATDVACSLEARAADHSLVGSLTVTPEVGGPARLSVEIATERRATAVELLGCTAAGQPRPR